MHSTIDDGLLQAVVRLANQKNFTAFAWFLKGYVHINSQIYEYMKTEKDIQWY